MKDSLTSRLENRDRFDIIRRHGKTFQQMSPQRIDRLDGRWLPVLLVGIYFASLWNPPISFPDLKWYFVLGLALIAFVTLKKPLYIHAARVFWIVFALHFLGAVLSLLRAPNLNEALGNTAGLGINFASYLLFLPVVATRRARRYFIWLLVGIAIIWAVNIQLLVARFGAIYLGTFNETGENKNSVGFCLSMASVAMLYLALLKWPIKKIPKWLSLAIRLSIGLVAVFLAYSVMIIYARGDVLATAGGICGVLAVVLVRNSGWGGRLRVGIIITVVAAFIVMFFPQFLAVSPEWNRLSDYNNKGLDAINTYEIRTVLLQKGIFLIGQNPIMGVGVGGSKPAVSSGHITFPYFLIHNTYLTDWAEKGILAVLGNLFWILIYIWMFKKKFFSLSITDQIWMLLFIPLFFEMFFMDMNSISMTMLLILSGIFYEQNLILQTRMALLDSKNLGT